MKLISFKNLAMTGALSVAGFGLVGAGAHAVFTQTTASAQQITAGTMNVTIASATAASGNNTSAITFAPAIENSSFTTGDQLVTITNNSNIPVKEITATPSDPFTAGTANAALAAEVSLCEVSSGEVIYNGLLSAAPAQAINGTLIAGGTDNYTVNIYAGNEPTACGAVTTPGNAAVAGMSTSGDLQPAAEGGVITPTMTVTYSG